jgi:beta-N-acetylhexosaminidase
VLSRCGARPAAVRLLTGLLAVSAIAWVAACGGARQPPADSAAERGSPAGNARRPSPTAPAEPHARPTKTSAARDPAPSAARALGQLIVGRFQGSSPPAAFLARVRAGEVGGVIIFSDNATGSPAEVRSTVTQLQKSAASGSNPPLLIMVDQEGGEVKRFPWAPPDRAPREMDSVAVAHVEGMRTGQALRGVGVNVDLAPVADVERAPGSFLGSRSFGSSPAVTGERACAFAIGLEQAGIGFTLKHFPGLGRATRSTDLGPVTIAASGEAIRDDYAAYGDCGSARSALVMVSSAAYPSLAEDTTPAVLSREIYERELPAAAGTQPVTISDDLEAGALAGQPAPAHRALAAGLDLLLYAQSEEGSADAFRTLLGELRSGTLPRASIERADRAVSALKSLVAGGPASDLPSAEEQRIRESGGEPGAPETLSPEPAGR